MPDLTLINVFSFHGAMLATLLLQINSTVLYVILQHIYGSHKRDGADLKIMLCDMIKAGGSATPRVTSVRRIRQRNDPCTALTEREIRWLSECIGAGTFA